MRIGALIALAAAASLSVTAAAQQPGPAGAAPPPRPAAGGGLPGTEAIEQVADNIYKIFGGGGNTLVVVQQDGVVLVDTKMPGNGQAILDEVRKVTDKPVTAIISTHSHPDHIGSTDFIRERYPDARVIMHETGKTEITANPNHNPGVVPNETYSDRMTLGEGDERIELYHTGPGHTGGDSFVVIPAAKLLFMGDVMAWNMAPFLPAGGAAAIADEIDNLHALVKDMGIEIVVEGHGHVNTWDGFERFVKFNRALLDAARAAYDRGDAPGAAVDELKRNPQFAELLDTNIKKGLEYGNTPLARAHMNVNIAFAEFAGEEVGFGLANGAPLPETDKHKGSDPADTAPPTPEMLAAAVAK